MKCITVLLSFMVLSVGVLIFATGCEDKPDTDGASDFFDGRDISADTRTPTKSPQMPAESATPLADLEILPAGAVTLAEDDDIVRLSLSGAKAPVVWSVVDTTLGEIVTQSNSAATYQRKAVGDNVVIVKDAAGREEYKVIKQPVVP